MVEKNVLYAATRSNYQDAVVSMKSLLNHTKVDNVFIFAEDDEFPYEMPDFVKTINVAEEKKLFKIGASKNYRLSYICLLRAIASRYLDVNRVLSIDTDTIVRNDISEVFDCDVSNSYFAGVWEPAKKWEALPGYVNFGVVLMNLEKTKEIEDIVITLLNACKFECGEQDVMNIVCSGKILKIPSKYNACPFTEWCREEEIAIKHYAGTNKTGFYNDKDYIKYLKMTWNEVLKGE